MKGTRIIPLASEKGNFVKVSLVTEGGHIVKDGIDITLATECEPIVKI